MPFTSAQAIEDFQIKWSTKTLSCTVFHVLSIFQAGRSGKTVPELEKTIGLMKRVVERVQRENEALKKSPATLTQEQFTTLRQAHDKLKVNNTLNWVQMARFHLYLCT